MKTIELDGRGWQSKDDFYSAILPALNAPEWHGRNLDALSDSLIAGRINGLEPPFRVVVQGRDGWGPELATFMRRVENLFEEAQSEGVSIHLEYA